MDEDRNLSILELFILSLTLYSVISLGMISIFPELFSIEMLKMVRIMDWICCGVFLIEWIIRLDTSKNKRKFIFFNLVDLASSLPYWLISSNIIWIWSLRSIKVMGNIHRTSTYLKNNTFNLVKYCITVPYLLILFISPSLLIYFEQEVNKIICLFTR